MMDLLNDETDEEIELVEIERRGKSRRDAPSGYRGVPAEKLYHILGAVQEDETDDFRTTGCCSSVRTARRMARTNTSSRRTSAKSSRLSAGMRSNPCCG